MSNFNLQTVFYKAKANSDSALNDQINTLNNLVEGLKSISPYLNEWFINNATSAKPPLEYLFPSEKSTKYFYKLRKTEQFDIFTIWNGHVERENYCDLSFSNVSLSMGLSNQLSSDQVIEITKVILNNVTCSYLYISSMFTVKNRVFEHRLPTSALCFVPKVIGDDVDLPFLIKKVSIDNSHNKGSILIFDENLFDESDLMKKKINEAAIALVDLEVLPEREKDRDFFSEVNN